MGDSMQAQQLREIEQDKIVKALRNEKSVLSAIIEARDGKIGGLTGQVSSLEKKIISQSEHITKLEISKQHLIQTQTKCVTAEAMIAEMKKEVHEFQVELEKARNIIDDLNKKYEGAQMTASKACADAEKLQSDMRKLKMERNSMKHKADGLSKEISKIYKNRLNVEEAERMQHEIQQLRRANIQLEDEVTDLRSQKRDALGELQATRIAHQQSVKYQLSVDENDGARAVEQRDELERLVSDLTEYLNAKEMQIETLKQINEALSKEINEANEKR